MYLDAVRFALKGLFKKMKNISKTEERDDLYGVFDFAIFFLHLFETMEI